LIRSPSRFRGRPASGGRGNVGLRLLDQTVGILLLWALGTLRPQRSRVAAPRRIGLMKTTGIGDMILLTAIARDVIAAFPGAEVIIFGGPENVDVARLVPDVQRVQLPTAKPWETVPLLRAQRLDVLVDFGQWTRLEGLYAALSGAHWTLGFQTPGQRRHYAYDATVRHSNQVHELENFRRLVAVLGIESRTQPSFGPSAEAPPPPLSVPYVVFHLWPGGFRSELREWAPDSWQELARAFVRENFSIVLTGGPGDQERTDAFVESCPDLAPHVMSVAGRYRVPELINVLVAARCVVSVNTGVMHLAAAVGVPTIALNGPTSSLRWGPVGVDVVCIESELAGCGYLDLGFEYDGQRTDCMRGISVDRVTTAALERAHA
jgi:ADP-heptose:LPS heptosyltransferase